MIKVLFVDDEQRLLSGLRRSLRDMRDEWDMHFCLSPYEALDAVRNEPFDVVVSDMRMPGMDGAELLAQVKEIRPESVRIILSGASDSAKIFRSMSVTHRYLDKPCDLERLKDAIRLSREDALAFVDGESAAPLLPRIDHLPAIPRVYQEVMRLLEDPDSTADKIGDVIEGEPALSSKLLQVVNSAAFGFSRPVEHVARAVALVGLDRVKQLLLALELFEQLRGVVDAQALERSWKHSARTLTLARRFAETLSGQPSTLEVACSAAVLHEAGRLVLAVNFGKGHDPAAEQIDAKELDRQHGRIGARLFSLWGLPASIIDCVEFHARPGEFGESIPPALCVVHAACRLADTPDSDAVDLDALARAGLADRLSGWRDIARETSGAPE
ncbi:MAG: HDOD domain-containing protein [Bryobacterales bacterium]|nr:HDOD domain-containing protein [Bryobacterales bacterium]